MALRFDRGMTFKRFGALDSDQIARLDYVVGLAHVSAIEAESLVPGFISNTWANIIGAESTAGAARSNAAAAQKLYEALQAKRDRLVNDPDAGEAEVTEMESLVSTGAFSNQAAREAAYLLTPVAAVIETGKGTYEDIAGAIRAPFGVPMWAWLAGAGALALFLFLPRRRS